MRATFRSSLLQERFERDGFVIVDLLERSEVARLRRAVEAIYVGERVDTAHSSVESPHLEYRRQMHELVSAALGPGASELLLDHEPFNSATIIKWPGPNSAMSPHQDWTAVDERRFRSVNMWVPLVDTDAGNGAMCLLPGSQRVLSRMRTSPVKPSSFADCTQGLDPASVPVFPMTAGQCLILDNALLHYSPPNTSMEPRVALVHGLAPKEADLYHFSVRPDDVVDRYRIVDPKFFLEFRPGMVPGGPTVQNEGPVDFHGDLPGAAAWLGERATVRPCPPVEDSADRTEAHLPEPTQGHDLLAVPEELVGAGTVRAKLRAWLGSRSA